MPGSRVLHQFHNRTILLHKHHAQPFGRLKGTEQNLCSPHLLRQVINAVCNVGQGANRSCYRAVRFEAKILDPVVRPQRVGDPDLSGLYIHLFGLSLFRRNTDVVESAHM